MPPSVAAIRRDDEAAVRGVEPCPEVVRIRHDERCGCGRRRCARVRREVHERGVLLVSDRGHHGDGAGGDGSHHRLVAEREQVLEAAAATGENHDVDVVARRQRSKTGDDRGRRAAALHTRLADNDLRRREALPERRDEVAARGSICSGEDPDRSRESRESPLAIGCEESLLGELPLEALERDEVRPQPEPLDRRRPEAELAPRLVQLGPAFGVDGLAFLEGELERVVRAAGERDLQARAGLRILERDENCCPRLVPPQLGDLAFDPDGGKPSEEASDAAVEGRHRVDLPVTVEDGRDLHAAQRSLAAACD